MTLPQYYTSLTIDLIWFVSQNWLNRFTNVISMVKEHYHQWQAHQISHSNARAYNFRTLLWHNRKYMCHSPYNSLSILWAIIDFVLMLDFGWEGVINFFVKWYSLGEQWNSSRKRRRRTKRKVNSQLYCHHYCMSTFSRIQHIHINPPGGVSWSEIINGKIERTGRYGIYACISWGYGTNKIATWWDMFAI